jgi:hypothetical protein
MKRSLLIRLLNLGLTNFRGQARLDYILELIDKEHLDVCSDVRGWLEDNQIDLTYKQIKDFEYKFIGVKND